MADKPLNQVTKVTDLSKVKTFLAVMDDNTIQQMSKEDMATVVGGLLPLVKMTQKGLIPTQTFQSASVSINNTTYYQLTNSGSLIPFCVQILGYVGGVAFSCIVSASGVKKMTDAFPSTLKFYKSDERIYYKIETSSQTTVGLTVIGNGISVLGLLDLFTQGTPSSPNEMPIS